MDGTELTIICDKVETGYCLLDNGEREVALRFTGRDEDEVEHVVLVALPPYLAFGLRATMVEAAAKAEHGA